MEVTKVIESAGLKYLPDYAVPPGETLRDTIEAMGMSQADLSRRTGLSAKHINQIVQGTAPISPDTALALERVIGVPARFWNALEANYQARVIKLRERVVSDEDAIWLKTLPVKQLIARGWLTEPGSASDLRDQVLAFFGVASRGSWEAVWLSPQASFRRSTAFQAEPGATAAWLRIGELEASELDVAEFDRGRFQEALIEIRSIMVQPAERFGPEMRRLCAETGVAFVIVDEITGSRASGAARWLSPTRALIQLSLRGRFEDMFWFSFFHEAGHVLLHGKRSAFVDGGDRDGAGEDEADWFAARHLIPLADERDLLRIRTLDAARQFAHRLGIPPAIVIGRLQKEGLLSYKIGNNMRRRFQLTATR